MSTLTPYRYHSPAASMLDNDFFRSFWWNDSYSQPFRVDVRDEGNHYSLDAELPGAKREDINIDVDNGVLTVSADWKNACDGKNCEEYIISERRYGHFQRSFTLENVKEDEIHADYTDGMLHVYMPKRDGTQKKSRKINLD